jgi:hypothetical protein
MKTRPLPYRLRRWRKPALVGASVAAHALILGGLAARVPSVEPPALRATPPAAIYLEIEPRLLLKDEHPRPAPSPASAATEAAPTPAETRPAFPGFRLPAPHQRDEDEDEPPPPAPPADGGAWQVRPETMGDRVARGLRTRASACAAGQGLSPEEQVICETRFAERAAAAPRVAGTGDADRDARFARQGARALSAYEERRRTGAMERPVCDKEGPIADCEVEIQVDIFSTVNGWFPNQRRDD